MVAQDPLGVKLVVKPRERIPDTLPSVRRLDRPYSARTGNGDFADMLATERLPARASRTLPAKTNAWELFPIRASNTSNWLTFFSV